jgi:hypothetical protein
MFRINYGRKFWTWGTFLMVWCWSQIPWKCMHWVRFHILTAASMKTTVFWDGAPCSLVETDQSFRGAYWLHHHITLMMEAVSTACMHWATKGILTLFAAIPFSHQTLQLFWVRGILYLRNCSVTVECHDVSRLCILPNRLIPLLTLTCDWPVYLTMLSVAQKGLYGIEW